MSAIKTRHEHKTILDLSNSKRLSEGQARRLLRVTEFLEGTSPQFIDYNIKVGSYFIHLHLINASGKPACHLKDYGDFYISINEVNARGKYSTIKLNRDYRFSDQYWISVNSRFQMRTKHLADVIILCQRLNNLKAFL